jgi:parallel beta-helix repeat protein
LNCKGHRISPSQAGTPDIAATAANEYQPSVPEIGILINGARKIKVHNCIIDNFDFGVLIANSKRTDDDNNHSEDEDHSGKIMLKNNTINGHYYGVRILRSDDVRIENNNIRYAMNARGKGIWTQGDSDSIEIIDNVVDGSTGIETVLVPLLPGGPRYNGRMDSIRFERGGVREGSLAGTVLLNLIIENQLYQYAYFGRDMTQIVPMDWIEGAMVSGNYVIAAPSTGTFAIALGGGLLAPVVESNTVVKGGAHFSGANHEVHTRPSTCSDDSARLCVTNADCFIPQIDTASKGTCTVSTHVVTQGVIDGIISANTIIGPFSGVVPFFGAAISTFPNSMNAGIIGNSVSNVNSGAGILLHSGGPLTTAVVTNNVVANSRFALQLQNNGASSPGSPPGGQASAFTANVSLNDFVGSTERAINVFSQSTYTLPTELSWNGRGNYWSHTCAEGGFLASDSPLPIIKDSHPYGEPVASTLTLPATCF